MSESPKTIRIMCPFCGNVSTAVVSAYRWTEKCSRCGAMYSIDDYPKKETTEAPMNITETRDDRTVQPERRTFEFTDLRTEKAEDGSYRVTGHAAVFDSLSKPLKTKSGKTFVEKIQPGAFARSLESNGDIVMLDDHDPKKVLARTSTKTLKLSEDERGLKFDAKLPDTTTARDLVNDIKHGNKKGVSFGFGDPEDRWDMEGETPVRTLLSIPLGEVSPTAFPAYPATNISVRADEAINRLAAGEKGVRCYGMSDRSDHEYAAENCRSAAMALHEAVHRAHELHMKENRSFTGDEMRSFAHAGDEMRRATRRASELRAYYRDMLDGDESEDDMDVDDIPGVDVPPNDDADDELDNEPRSITDLMARQMQLAIEEGLSTDELRSALQVATTPPQRVTVVDGQHFVLDEAGEKRVAGPYKFKMQAVRKLKLMEKNKAEPAPPVEVIDAVPLGKKDGEAEAA